MAAKTSMAKHASVIMFIISCISGSNKSSSDNAQETKKIPIRSKQIPISNISFKFPFIESQK
jgi:hypothetical protein